MTLKPLRFSDLKWMGLSPAHYQERLTHPMKQTKAMLLGDALDARFFASKEVLVFDGASRRSKAWDTFAEAHPEAVKLLAPEQEQVEGMLASLQANPRAMDLLTGETQRTIQWDMAGRQCQGTPDVFRKNRVVELKSTISANPERFIWDARKRAYHAQVAWYHNGLKVVNMVEPDAECWIVAVESTAPYPVICCQLTPKAYEEGNKRWVLWFERLLVCEKSNRWPGYTDAVVPFDALDSEGLTLTIEGEEVEVE